MFEVGKHYATESGEVWEVTRVDGLARYWGVPQPIEAERVLMSTGVFVADGRLSGTFTEEGWYGTQKGQYSRNLIPVPVNSDGTPVVLSEDTEETAANLRLEKAVLYFSQEPNCIDGGNPEEIRVRIEGSTGCDDSAFAVIETDRWALEIDELPPSIKAVVDRVLSK